MYGGFIAHVCAWALVEVEVATETPRGDRGCLWKVWWVRGFSCLRVHVAETV